MSLFDLVRVSVSTVGTGGPLQLGAADGGGRTFAAAGVPDGASVSYGIVDGSNRETGTGVYNSGANTLTRNFGVSTTGSLLNLSGQAALEITPLAADLASAGGPTRFNVSLAGTWIIPHGFGRMPLGFPYLANGEAVIADVFIDATNITVVHAQPQQGFVLAF